MLLLTYNCNVSTFFLISSLLYIVPFFAKALMQNNFRLKFAIQMGSYLYLKMVITDTSLRLLELSQFKVLKRSTSQFSILNFLEVFLAILCLIIFLHQTIASYFNFMWVMGIYILCDVFPCTEYDCMNIVYSRLFSIFRNVEL